MLVLQCPTVTTVEVDYKVNNNPTAVCPESRKDGPSLLLVLKWGGELTPAGRVQAEELGRAFRCMYPGGQGRDTATHQLACALAVM